MNAPLAISFFSMRRFVNRYLFFRVIDRVKNSVVAGPQSVTSALTSKLFCSEGAGILCESLDFGGDLSDD